MDHKIKRRYSIANSKYKDQVLKLGSYYGTIREVEIQKTGSKGQKFQTRIINIYVDPSKYENNARSYHGEPYTVDKGNVAYPNKTRWKSIDLKRVNKGEAVEYERPQSVEDWEKVKDQARKRKRVKSKLKRLNFSKKLVKKLKK